MIQEIMELSGLTIDKAGFELLAADLSELAGKRPPWSWRYCRSVFKGDYPASKKMNAAMIAKLAELVDGTSRMQAASVEVRVFTAADQAHRVAGSYVMGSAKQCPQCGARFVGNVPWRKYCLEYPKCREYRLPVDKSRN